MTNLIKTRSAEFFFCLKLNQVCFQNDKAGNFSVFSDVCT